MANDFNQGSGLPGAGGGGFFSGLMSMVGPKLTQQREEQAKQKDAQAQIYIDGIKRAADNGTLTPEALGEARTQLQKIYGSTPAVKGILDRVHQFIGTAMGHGKDAAAGGGAAPGQLPAPPVINAINAAHAAPDASAATPGGGAPTPAPAGAAVPSATSSASAPGSTAGSPAPAPGALPPPPKSGADAFMSAAYPSFAQQTQMGIDRANAQHAAQITLRKSEALSLGMQEGTPEFNRYVLAGQVMPIAHGQQKIGYLNGKSFTYTYDPIQHTNTMEDGSPVPAGAVLGASGAPKRVVYVDPTSHKPMIGFQEGTSLVDMSGKPLPDGVQAYEYGTTPMVTEREQITYGPDGTPQINTLTTTRTPAFGAGGASAAPGAPAGKSAAPKAGAKTKLPPPPVAGVTDGTGQTAVPTDSKGKPLGSSSGMVNTTRNLTIPVFNAGTQFFGDPKNPAFKGLDSYGALVDDPQARQAIGTALRISLDNLKDQEEKHGGMINWLQNTTGIKGAIKEAENKPLQDALSVLAAHPDWQAAYDANLAAMEQGIGLRAANKASSSQASITALQSNFPFIGVNTQNSQQFYDKMMHLAEEVHRVSTLIPNAALPSKAYFDSKIAEMAGKAKSQPKPTGGKLPTPPGGAPPPSVDDQIMKAIHG